MDDAKTEISEPGRLRQTFAAFVVNIASLSYGTMLGWPSPIIIQLQGVNTPVGNSAMSNEESSWLASGLSVGALVTMPFCSVIAERLGRRMTGCLMVVPFSLCWLLTIFAKDFSYLLAARFFAGIGGAVCYFLVPLYVSEISADGIRGQLGSFLVFGINIGVVMAYVTGASVSYRLNAICTSIGPLLFLAAFVFMPETPIYLVRRNRPEDAARSLLWLKNGDKASADRELSRLRLLANEEMTQRGSSSIKDLFRDRGTSRASVLALGLFAGQQLCGITPMINYAAMIFKMAGSSLSPDTAAVTLGLIQIFGSWLATVMMERAGRRILLLTSCLGMAMCHCAIAIFCQMQNDEYDVDYFRWVPVTALSVFAIVYNIGMGSGTFVVASEIFSPDLRSLANSVAQLLMWILSFLLVKFFPTMMNAIGVAGCFFFLGSCCFATFFFVFLLIPETKGRTLESILDELNGVVGSYDRKNHTTAMEMARKHRNLST